MALYNHYIQKVKIKYNLAIYNNIIIINLISLSQIYTTLEINLDE